MSETRQKPALTIQSHKGPYQVYFDDKPFAVLTKFDPEKTHFIIDQRLATLYPQELAFILGSEKKLLLAATEPAKTLDQFTGYVEQLMKNGVKRGHMLVAVGGGVIQDIVCFLAATLFRGLDWSFYPTTLLAQADSCIGSKSSINVGATKNLMGTFTPPKEVFICARVLKTLEDKDIRSGIGEMLKVHVIDGPKSFDIIAKDYDCLKMDDVMERYILRSLDIKKKIIEVDEFDQNIRNVMNYGHSFGHAIEAATDFLVPHGLGVTIGMDMANFMSVKMRRMDESHFQRMHRVCVQNFHDFRDVTVPLESFFSAIRKDKKNVDANLSLILPNSEAKVERVKVAFDDFFKNTCQEYFSSILKN